MSWREKRYYILEMRYRSNGFLMDEVEYYRSEKKAKRVCEKLNKEREELCEVIMVNKPFVGKGCVSFSPEDVYYTVSDLRRPMAPEWTRKRKFSTTFRKGLDNQTRKGRKGIESTEYFFKEN